jgi:prephenate dehydrogenase
MDFSRITIIGVGHIGGSLARALKRSGHVGEVYGVDRDQNTLEYALQEQMIDLGSSNPKDAVKNSDIVVIATYIRLIPKITKSIVSSLSSKTVVTDVGSIKARIVKEIEDFLPENIHFVGGHPIAGTERSGISSSDSEVFRGKKCVLTTTSKTHKESLDKVGKMWELAGAKVITMDPEYHDRVFASVSHLPHVVAYALVNSVASAGGEDDFLSFAGGGLRDFTRISESSPELWSEILLANKKNVLESLRGFKREIEKIQSQIEAGDLEVLEEQLRKAARFGRSID